MSTRYNTKHPERSKSKYPKRLKARGLTKAPSLPPVEQLRTTQERRIRETCPRNHQHFGPNCEGHPWWTPGRADSDEEAAA